MTILPGNKSRTRAFTLVELLVVTVISLLLLAVGGTIYVKCLNIYQDSQGLTEIYETARLIERDMRDHLGYVTPIKGRWITPTCYRFPGGGLSNQRRYSYYSFGHFGHRQFYSHASDTRYDFAFSGPQFGFSRYDHLNHIGANRNRGYTSYPAMWGELGMHLSLNNLDPHSASWWAPAFFGHRDGSDPDILAKHNNEVGAWGFPRPDYRLDADAGDLVNHHNVACWFYCEDRDFDSPLTLALDNPNIVLASMKFSRWEADGHEYTQLSMLKHHLSGFDQPGRQGSRVRADYGYGNMIRAIKISPYYLDAGGNLAEMGDLELGCDLQGAAVNPGGEELPRCFDVALTLQNPYSYQRHTFGYRYYNLGQPD